jgi:8-oxo-dGTP pyrophosphatase MutT (NUDIX family)
MPDRRIGAAAVILDDAGRVLLVHHSYGRLNWELPGGYSEPGESAVDTALREVREETGLEVVPERVTGIYYDPGDDMHHFVLSCKLPERAAPPRPDGAEITELGYFGVESLPRPISDFTLRRIADALAGSPLELPTAVGPRRWIE